MASASTTSWTILRLLEWTTNFLRERGALTPRLDAEVLLAHCRKCSRLELYMAFEQEASDELRQQFRHLVRQRADGTPVAYLVGNREFFSRSFTVTPDVLIPRPETELLITTLLDLVGGGAARQRPWRLADVGTGSGILAITACLELPQATAVALDLSSTALAVARQNAMTHDVDQRIEFLESDLLGAVPVGTSFDFVLSNPPYVSESEYRQLDRGIREFEPRMALEAGPRGTAVIERLIPQAAERLGTEGWFLCEISPMIEPLVRTLLAQDPRFTDVATIRDLARLPRVLVARRSSRPRSA